MAVKINAPSKGSKRKVFRTGGEINISQRQATIFVLGFQWMAIIILWLNQIFSKNSDPNLTLGAGIAGVVYGAMFFAYIRGWDYARHTSVVLITLIVAAFLPEPFVTTYAPFLLLLGPILALVLLNPLWVIGSAIATIVLLLLRAGGVGVYASLTTLLNYAMLIAGLVVSRIITETARTRVEKTEKALTESEERFRKTFHSVPVGLAITRASDGAYIDANDAFSEITGYSHEELTGQTSLKLNIISPEQRQNYTHQIREQGFIHNQEMTLRNKSGESCIVLGSMEIIELNHETCVLSAAIDITERKRAEDAQQMRHDELELGFQQRTIALSQATALLETMLEYVPDQIYFKDAESRFIKNSKSQAMALGLSDPAEVVGKTDFDFFPHAQRSFDEEQEIIRSGKPLVDFEEKVVWPDRKETWVSTSKVPLRNQEGRVIGTFGISRDITDRKRAEEALRKARDELEVRVTERTVELIEANNQLQLELGERKQVEEANERLAAIVESSDDAIMGKTLDGIITSWNAGAEKVYGYMAAEVVGHPISILIPPERPDELPTILNRIRMGESIKHLEAVRLRKDGQLITVSLTISPVSDAAGKISGASTIARDITERKRAEEVLRANESNARSLISLSKKLEQAETYSEALGAALDEVKAVLGYQSVWTYLLSEDKKQGHLLTITGEKSQIATENFPTLTIKGDRFLEEIVEAKDIVLVEDARTDPRTNKEIVAQLGNRTIVNVPIIFMDRHLGIFGTGTFGDEGVRVPTSIQRDYLRALASHLAVTLDRIHLLTQRKKVEAEIRQLNENLEQRIAERTLALHESREQYRTLFDSIDEGFCIIEMIFDEWEKPVDYRFLSVNPAFEKQTGLSDAQGKTMRWFAPNHEEYWFEIYGRIALTGEPARFENRAEQLHRWYDVYAFRFGEPEKRQVAILFNDISQRKAVEAEVQRLNKDLQQHSAQLESANKELEAFSYSVSHDLRSPLRGIDGWSLALLEDYGGLLDAQGQSHIQRVRSETQRMGILIDDILQLSRITRAGMKKEKVDLSAIAETVVDRLQETKPEDRKVEFIIQKGLTAMGDPKLLDVVLTNLLGNAFKFTGKKEVAHIEFGEKVIEGERAFFVCDNGAGFDMGYSNKLFGAFQRMHRTSEFPGTGVGLAIVQRVIHRHGGSIWASSEVGQGTTFYFTLEDHNEK